MCPLKSATGCRLKTLSGSSMIISHPCLFALTLFVLMKASFIGVGLEVIGSTLVRQCVLTLIVNQSLDVKSKVLVVGNLASQHAHML